MAASKALPVSPLAPAGGFPDLPEIPGVRFATCAAGVKYAGRDDVMLVELAPGTAVAGVYTRSSTCSAAVSDCRAKTGGDPASGAAILVNSGNANAFTGSAGTASVKAICDAVANRLGVPAGRVFTASTGVIGERLPHDRIVACIDDLATRLDGRAAADAARAIMTTDTFAKGATTAAQIGGARVQIAGFAKGSGMIAPDMATMIACVFTDATVEQALLQAMLSETVGRTFNAITVDSDTSTSDTLIVAATGQAGAPAITARDTPEGMVFLAALESVLRDLAQQVVRDGEGASKFIEIRVTGAVDDREARQVALSIANSPLVKTAIAGEDANWGRVVMAVGKSGAHADRDKLSIRFGDILVAENGWVAASYREEQGAAFMKQREIAMTVDLGLGEGQATVWTCDLTHGYIDINADYRS